VEAVGERQLESGIVKRRWGRVSGIEAEKTIVNRVQKTKGMYKWQQWWNQTMGATIT
jgi:hypothetical protein